MRETIRVNVEGKGEFTVEKGSTLEDLSKMAFGKEYKKYLGARINNQIYHLQKSVKEGMNIRFLSIRDDDGNRIYARTISAVFIMACESLFPQCTVKIEHSIGEGIYAELEGGKSISFSEIRMIKEKMEEITEGYPYH